MNELKIERNQERLIERRKKSNKERKNYRRKEISTQLFYLLIN